MSKDNEGINPTPPCPECGAPIGGTTATDPYKHAVGCFRLDDRGAEYYIKEYKSDTSERGKRIFEIMSLAAD